jgi:hypothetical protein
MTSTHNTMKHIIALPFAIGIFIVPAYIDNKFIPWIMNIIENIL